MEQTFLWAAPLDDRPLRCTGFTPLLQAGDPLFQGRYFSRGRFHISAARADLNRRFSQSVSSSLLKLGCLGIMLNNCDAAVWLPRHAPYATTPSHQRVTRDAK